MVYLKSIDAIGFKSFADQTNVQFMIKVWLQLLVQMEAVKVILQMLLNGCWGEQSAKSLRGSKMEDIIFSGAEHRKAQIMLKYS